MAGHSELAAILNEDRAAQAAAATATLSMATAAAAADSPLTTVIRRSRLTAGRLRQIGSPTRISCLAR
ncbi:hypothetical protein, partial [Mesorhizobium sp. B2-2-4]|uniref:hypothetical protein n=1 Tax=Mesorhizobium sp. B2-2-4 TaxID=2589962 RepID=UPI001AEF0E7A